MVVCSYGPGRGGHGGRASHLFEPSDRYAPARCHPQQCAHSRDRAQLAIRLSLLAIAMGNVPRIERPYDHPFHDQRTVWAR